MLSMPIAHVERNTTLKSHAAIANAKQKHSFKSARVAKD